MQASHVPSSGLKDERIRACDEQSAGQTVPGLLPAPGTDLTLKTLRARIAASSIPPSQLDESITLATWNIREFGKRPRLPASLHYIAEIIGCFDLVSVVELRDNLADLHTVLGFLGPTWKAIFSDFLTDSGGNRERMAFLYDSRAVQFTGLASNAISTRKKDRAGNYLSPLTWWRPPFVASFSAGHFDFVLIAAHIRWGDDEAGRIPELQLLADWVAERRAERFEGDKDFIVVGDFNIPASTALSSRRSPRRGCACRQG